MHTCQSSVANMSNNISAKQSVALDIGVIGAGIAGLSAAIGLCRAGHRVEVCFGTAADWFDQNE